MPKIGTLLRTTIALLFVSTPAVRGTGALAPPAQASIMSFNGSGIGYTSSVSVGSNFTMETWVSLDVASGYAVIMGKPFNPRGNDPYMNYVIGLDSVGTSLAFVQTTGQAGTYRQLTAPAAMTMRTWTHVAA